MDACVSLNGKYINCVGTQVLNKCAIATLICDSIRTRCFFLFFLSLCVAKPGDGVAVSIVTGVNENRETVSCMINGPFSWIQGVSKWKTWMCSHRWHYRASLQLACKRDFDKDILKNNKLVRQSIIRNQWSGLGSKRTSKALPSLPVQFIQLSAVTILFQDILYFCHHLNSSSVVRDTVTDSMYVWAMQE